MVLPPLMEWVRVASSFAEYRHSAHIDNDDILQAGNECHTQMRPKVDSERYRT